MAARIVFAYAFAGIPLLLMAFQQFGVEAELARRLILAANGACLLVPLLVRPRILRSYRHRVGALATLGLFIGFTFAVTYWQEGTSVSDETSLRVRAFLALLVWLLPCVAGYVALRSPGDIRVASDWLQRGLLLVSASVIAGAVAPFAGASFGETLTDASGWSRHFGPLGDQSAFLAVEGAVFALWLRRHATAGVHAAAVLLSGTRGAAVLLALAMCLFAWQQLGRGNVAARARRLRTVIAFGCLVVAIGMTPVGRALHERWTNAETRQAGLQARLGAIGLGFEAAMLNPVIGGGFGSYGGLAYLLGAQHRFTNFNPVYVSTASSQLVQTAVEGGIVGTTLLAAFLAMAYLSARRLSRLFVGKAGAFFGAAALWMLLLVVGNQSVVWLLPVSTLALNFAVLVAVALKTEALGVARRATPKLDEAEEAPADALARAA